MPWTGSYEELCDYLRQFVKIWPDPFPYEFNGVVHLMLASLDNLRHNASEDDLQGIRASFTDEQTTFFLKLAEYLRQDEEG